MRYCAFIVLVAASCGPAHVAINPSVNGDPPSLRVAADWNDVNAAAEVAGPQVELAMLSGNESEATPGVAAEKRFVFLATDDTEIDLTVRQSRPGEGESAPGALDMTAAARPRRDREREARLLSAMARRLTDLSDKEWAPVRE